MCNQSISFRHRLFARFMAGEDERSHEKYKEKKAELFSEVRGRVLELGPGTGVNLPFFPKDINWIGIEPNAAMHPYLKEKADELGLKVEFCEGLSKNDGIEDDSFDFAVSTLVLCSVDSVETILGEIRRSLKPGGKFLFIEHVVDQSNFVRRLVQKLVPFTPWRYFSDGCNPGRNIGSFIKDARFSAVDCRPYFQDGVGIISWVNKPHIYGYAVK